MSASLPLGPERAIYSSSTEMTTIQIKLLGSMRVVTHLVTIIML